MTEAPRIPDDAVTIRQASTETGVSLTRIRSWIYQARDLPTYRLPGMGERVMVSIAEVSKYAMRNSERRRARGQGETSIRLDEASANDVRRLAKMIGERIGTGKATSLRDAVVIAVHRAIRTEEART